MDRSAPFMHDIVVTKEGVEGDQTSQRSKPV